MEREGGRITPRPQLVAAEGAKGLRRLGLADGRDGWLYVPDAYRPDRPAPFLLCLHGAGGSGRGSLDSLMGQTGPHGVILLAPDSRLSTWDAVRGGFGPDVAYINEALEAVFQQYSIDPAYVAIEGFSDGGSYALSLGISNGDLFRVILAFSPGFMLPDTSRGAPRIFVSHGTGDAVLPIDRTGRLIATQLERAGYNLTYVEFDGPHTVPPDIAARAVEWYLAPLPHVSRPG